MPRGGLSQDPDKRARQLAGLRKGQEKLAARLADPDYSPQPRKPKPTRTEQVTSTPQGDVHVLQYPEPPAQPPKPKPAAAPAPEPQEPTHAPDPEVHTPDDEPLEPTEARRKRSSFLDGFRAGL